MYLDISQIKSYQQELLKYNWFEPTLIACAGVLIFFGILMFFATFKPTHKSQAYIVTMRMVTFILQEIQLKNVFIVLFKNTMKYVNQMLFLNCIIRKINLMQQSKLISLWFQIQVKFKH